MPLKNCPDDRVMAAFVDGVLPEADMSRWREHISACADCRRLVADLVIDRRIPLDSAVPEIPAEIRERVRRLVPGGADDRAPQLTVLSGGASSADPGSAARVVGSGGTGRARWMRPQLQGLLLAAAAGLLLLFGLRWLGAPASHGPSGADIPEMRGGDSTAFATLYPGDRAILALTGPEALELAWSPLPASLLEETGRGGVDHYEVVLLDASGGPVWSTKTHDTRVHVTHEAPLMAGQTYSWTVTAQLELGRRISTRATRFTISR